MTKTLQTIAILTLLSLSACGPETPAPKRMAAPVPDMTFDEVNDEVGVVVDTDKSIKIAVLLPLSGPEAALGASMLKAATLALFDAYDPRLKLYPLDTGGRTEGARNAADQAIELGAKVVVGPLLSGNIQAAGNILATAGIPLIGFSSDSTVAQRGRYVMGFLPETEVSRVTSYAIDQGYHEFGALIPDSKYGERVRDAFGDAVYDGAANITAMQVYPNDPDNVQEPVKKIAQWDKRRKEVTSEVRALELLRDDVTDEIADALKDKEVISGPAFTAVLLPEGGALLRTLAPLLSYYEVDPNVVKLLGTGLWNDPTLLNEPPLRAGWFAGTDPAALRDFSHHYESIYNEPPARIASIAYDSIGLIATLVREQLDIDAIVINAEMIENQDGFSGVDGLFRFLSDGTIERALAILEINPKGFKIVDPAQKAFPTFGFGLKQVSNEPND